MPRTSNGRPRFRPEEDAEIAALYKSGKTIVQLSELKRVSRRMIWNSLSRSQAEMRPRNTERPESEWTICECGSRAIYTKGVCRPCYDYERNRDPAAQDRKLTWKLAKYYNISREDYESLLRDQGGACAICRKPPPSRMRLCIDHDHTCCPGSDSSCGKCIRGLLCVNCNRALGYLRDSVEIAENLTGYLRKHARDAYVTSPTEE